MVSTVNSKTYIISETSQTTTISQSQSVPTALIVTSPTDFTTNMLSAITDTTRTTISKEFPILSSLLNSTGLHFNFAQLTSSQTVDILKLD